MLSEQPARSEVGPLANAGFVDAAPKRWYEHQRAPEGSGVPEQQEPPAGGFKTSGELRHGEPLPEATEESPPPAPSMRRARPRRGVAVVALALGLLIVAAVIVWAVT